MATTLGRGGSRPGETFWTQPKVTATPKVTTTPKNTATAKTTTVTATPQTNWNDRTPSVPEQEAPSWIGPGLSNTGSGGTSSANSAYQDALDALRAREEAEKEAARARTQATIDSINSNIPKVNQDYENQQAQNYITHTKNMYGLGDYLRYMGLGGGMSETKAGELTANYETARNSADQAKNNAMDNIRQLVAQAQATGDEGLATIATNANDAYRQLLAQQANAELQADQTATAQAIDERRYQDSLTQQAFENDLATKEYQLAAQRAKTSGTSGGSGGSGTSRSEIYKAVELGLLDEDVAKQMLGFNNNSNSNSIDYTKVTQIINGLGNYMAGRGTNQAAVTYVQQLLNKGSISQAEYNYILNKFGYNM